MHSRVFNVGLEIGGVVSAIDRAQARAACASCSNRAVYRNEVTLQDWPRLGGREKPFSMDQTLTAYKCILSVLVLIHSVKSYHDDEIGYDRGGLMALDAEG